MIRIEDRIFEDDIGTVLRLWFNDKYESAENNEGAGTLTVQKNIPSVTPSTGTLKIYNALTRLYDDYAYTSFADKIFTLSGKLSRDYPLGTTVKVPVDISSANTKQIHLKFSDKTTAIENLSLTGDGTDGGAFYTSKSGDLSPSGKTKAQGYVVTPNGEWRSEYIEFVIQPKLI